MALDTFDMICRYATQSDASTNEGLTEYEKLLFETDKVVEIVDMQNKNYIAHDLVIPETVTKLGICAFGLTPPQIGAVMGIILNSVVIPKTIETIPANCFTYQMLTSVEFNDGLISIERGAFNGCFGIQGLSLPPTLKLIGDSAFYSTGISEITIPEGVTTIGSTGFGYCPNLKTANLPSTLIVDGNESGIFTQCTALETVNINMPEGSFDVSDYFGLTPTNVNWLG